MSEQQATINPSDSASNLGGKVKRVRPGKAARAAARQGTPATASTVTGTASMGKAESFSSKVFSNPVPQPGKFPVVFPSGAGEASKDVVFALDGKRISDSLCDLPGRFIHSPRFAEFSAHAEYGAETFTKDIARFTILGLAQQIVHAHQNMQLSIGDFSSIANTDVTMMSSIRKIIQQYGEFSVDPLGTRYLLANYETTVKSLIHASNLISSDACQPVHIPFYIKTMWLPAERGDTRTTFIVATALSDYFSRFGVKLSVEELQRKLFVEESHAFNAMKGFLPEADRGKFDALFTGYQTRAEFAAVFAANNRFILEALGLYWAGVPHADHMDWSIVPKTVFPNLVDVWARKKPIITKFFSCGSGLHEKANACGSASQLTCVAKVEDITVVNSMVALSAPEFSLLACFPPCAIMAEKPKYNVVLTTSVSTKERATQFMLLDWLG
jgi:hypothetical protein